MNSAIHPAPTQFTPDQIEADPILHFFHYSHLPEKLQSSSRPFCNLAALLIDTLPRNAERSVALRKLLEAKDAAVRANVTTHPTKSTFVPPADRTPDPLHDLDTEFPEVKETGPNPDEPLAFND